MGASSTWLSLAVEQGGRGEPSAGMLCHVLGLAGVAKGLSGARWRSSCHGRPKEDFLEKGKWDKPVNRAVGTPLAGASDRDSGTRGRLR